MTSPAHYLLYGHPGWGSVIVEAQLAALGLPFDYEEVPNLFESDAARRELCALNPLAQVPTLRLPDGTLMTESAAITLHLAETSGRDDFVPGPAEPSRPAFLRWLVYLVANIYPTFTYGDVPTRFVPDEAAAKVFGAELDEYRIRLWRQVEAAAGSPWFLGERRSAIDIYIAAMRRWRPGRRWFAEHAPRLSAIADRMLAEPAMQAVWAHNDPPPAEAGPAAPSAPAPQQTPQQTPQ